MAETPDPQSGKTLEMRVAELEDKLAQTQITADDIKAYQKVAAALSAKTGTTSVGGVASGSSAPAPSPQLCVIHHPCIISHPCVIHHPCVVSHPCVVMPSVSNCAIQSCQCLIQSCQCAIQSCQCNVVAADSPASAFAAPPTQQDFENLGS